MTLLEEVTKAAAERVRPEAQDECPVVLNPEFSFVNLKAKVENPNPASLVCPLTDWKVSETDAALTSAIRTFSDELKLKLKDGKRFSKNDFLQILTPFLENVLEIAGVFAGVAPNDRSYTKFLIEKAGGFTGKEAARLVLDACLLFELWELVECMIVRGIVDQTSYRDLILHLVLKRRSDLICLCISHALDLQVTELLCVLKYFCCPPKDAFPSMTRVRKEWESQEMLAIRMSSDKNLRSIESDIAIDAAILLMIAYDDFLDSEFCLHYLLSSSNIDEVVLSSAINKLNDEELSSLIQYLGKWLKKYERFPRACPCPKALSTFEFGALVWAPKLEDVVKWVGLIVDANFSSLVLHSEFHEELRSMQVIAGSLAAEAKASSSLANIVDDDLHKIVREVDANDDGCVSFEEFVVLNTKGVDGNEIMENLREDFSVYDRDGNGEITAEELHDVLRSLGEECTLGECRKMISDVDGDGDGMISFEEFKMTMTDGSRMDTSSFA